MSLAPNQQSGSDSSVLSPVAVTVLFGVLVILLAVVLRRMASSNHPKQNLKEVSGPEFTAQVDKNNIREADFAIAQRRTSVKVELRQPDEWFHGAVENEDAPQIISRLEGNGAAVHTTGWAPESWSNYGIHALPIIFLAGIRPFRMGQMRRRKLNGPPKVNL